MKILETLQHLGYKLGTTASLHKKKLIFLLILIIGYKAVRRNLKTSNIISMVMFFFKLWGKVMEYLPLPTESNYRHTEPFKSVDYKQCKEMVDVVNIKDLLNKVKNREHNALDQLKIGVISGVLLNLVLYKVETVYQLIRRKYHMDFAELGAATEFEQSINALKLDFIKNLPNFRSFIVTQIGSQIFKISLTEMTNPQKIRKQFEKIIQLLYKQSMDIRQKVRPRKTQFQQTKQYKIASNYYRTTKQYMEQPKKAKSIRVLGFLAGPVKLLYRGVKSLLKTPEEVMTTERYQINQYFYILPLKKYKNNVNWPSLQSKYLFGMVLDQLINFFYSINFNIVSQKRTYYNLEFFMNRVYIYFEKKAKCTEKKFMEMLPIFHKIIQQQFTNPQKQALFHDRQLFQAFRQTKFAPASKVTGTILSHALDPAQPQKLQQHRLRNRVLKQIYLKNQIQHLEKDMQAKLYSERDGLVIEAVGKTGKLYQGKDDIQKFMELNQKADVEGDTKGQMRMMLDLANQ